jgi:anti-sigma-K factor RskA
MMTCEQCRDEMAEHALGQSDPETAAAMRDHLAACVVCRREFAEIESAWAALPLACEPSAPGPQVFERVRSRIDQLSGKPAPSAAERPPSPLTPRQRLLSYVLAASVLAALIGGSLVLRNDAPRGSTGDVAADRALRDLAGRLGKLQELEQMLRSDGVKLASLHAPASERVGAYVLWDLTTGQWHVFAPGLPPAPAGKTYQLWAVAEGSRPLAGPTFVVGSSGIGSVVADFPELKPGAAITAVVTLEPAGGSEAPSGDSVLEAPL